MTCRATKQGLVLIRFGFARLDTDLVFSFKACTEVTRGKDSRWSTYGSNEEQRQ